MENIYFEFLTGYTLCEQRRYTGGAMHLALAMPKRSQSNLRHSP
jgi:hypothetical protein